MSVRRLELVTFGAPQLRDGGEPVDLPPKHLGVLAYLAVAGSGGVKRRDTLLAVFWPRLDDPRARNALNQSVYELRQVLGAEALVSHGKEGLSLDPGRVPCDAVRFLERLDRGDPEAALDVYGGDFLDGFHLSHVPEFERWADGERSRMSRAAVAAAGDLAEEAAAAGDLAAATARLRRGLRIAPTDERLTRRLVELLGRSGDRAEAVRVYEAFAHRFQEELGLSPSPATRAALEAARGDRTAEHGPSYGTSAVSASAPVPDAASRRGVDRPRHAAVAASPATAESGHERRTVAVAALAVVALLVVLVLGFVRSEWGPFDAGGDEESIAVAVLPFRALGNDSLGAHFADGLAEELLDGLAGVGGLRVAARSSSFRFRDAEIDVREIADSLGVDAVVEGSVRRRGDRLRIAARVVGGEDGLQLWSETFDHRLEMPDLFRTQEEIARSIAIALDVRMGPEDSRRIRGMPTHDLEAYSLYLRAMAALHEQNSPAYQEAHDLFSEALARDSSFAEAWAGLALLYLGTIAHDTPIPDVAREDALPRGREAVDRALALDEGMAAAHVARGLLARIEGDDRRGERAYRRAIELQPSNAPAHRALAFLLLAHGRVDEALEAMRRAQLLDPFSLVTNGGLGRFLYHAGRYGEAITQLRKTLEMGFYDRAAYYLPMALTQAGRHEEAVIALDAMPDSIFVWGQLRVRGIIAAFSGDRTLAREILDRLKAQAFEEGVETSGGTTDVASLYAALGELDSAFAWIDRRRAPFPIVELIFVRGNPVFEPLRSDPRYAELVRRIDPAYPEVTRSGR